MTDLTKLGEELDGIIAERRFNVAANQLGVVYDALLYSYTNDVSLPQPVLSPAMLHMLCAMGKRAGVRIRPVGGRRIRASLDSSAPTMAAEYQLTTGKVEKLGPFFDWAEVEASQRICRQKLHQRVGDVLRQSARGQHTDGGGAPHWPLEVDVLMYYDTLRATLRIEAGIEPRRPEMFEPDLDRCMLAAMRVFAGAEDMQVRAGGKVADELYYKGTRTSSFFFSLAAGEEEDAAVETATKQEFGTLDIEPVRRPRFVSSGGSNGRVYDPDNQR
jgi:hypothetical protein